MTPGEPMGSSDDRDRLNELAASSALGATSADEERELAALVGSDPDRLQIVREYRDAAAALALALPEVAPAPAVRDNVLAAIAAMPRAAGAAPSTASSPAGGAPASSGAPVIPLAARRRVRPSVIVSSTALAAAAAMAILWWGEHRIRLQAQGELVTVSREMLALRRSAHRATALEHELARSRPYVDALGARDLRFASVGAQGGPTMKVFMRQGARRWLVLASDLPPLDPARDYQLWLVPASGGAPISAGLLRTGPGGTLEATVEVPASIEPAAIGQAAISLEPKGGSTTPTEVKLIGPLI